ncbi:MAG: ECF transporter S component [Clostridia bacterium]|nr:ECF transporter S component [Clostridia bacterium]
MKTKNIVLSALLIALIVVATAFVSIPIPLGYVHLGDAVIVVACFMLKPKWSIPISAIASALADLILGYFIYIPATLIVKAGFATCFALIVYNKPNLLRCVIAFLIGTVIIALGYFVYEAILYGAGVAIVNVPFNLLQGSVCGLIGGLLIQGLQKIEIVVAFRNQK